MLNNLTYYVNTSIAKCYLIKMRTTIVPCSTNIGIYAWF
jgi:hypothetical protein